MFNSVAIDSVGDRNTVRLAFILMSTYVNQTAECVINSRLDWDKTIPRPATSVLNTRSKEVHNYE